MKTKPKGSDLAKSCERQFFHKGPFTVLICRFAFDDEAHTVAIKRGIFTTFGDFIEHRNPLEIRINAKSKKDAADKAAEYINGKLNDPRTSAPQGLTPAE